MEETNTKKYKVTIVKSRNFETSQEYIVESYDPAGAIVAAICDYDEKGFIPDENQNYEIYLQEYPKELQGYVVIKHKENKE